MILTRSAMVAHEDSTFRRRWLHVISASSPFGPRLPVSNIRFNIMIPAYEPLLLSYGTASEQLRVAATILWRSGSDAVSYGPDED